VAQVEAIAVRDQLRALFEERGIPVRVEVATVRTTTSVCVTPLPLDAAQRLLRGLCGCAHTGPLEEQADGRHCAECGALIYPREALAR
jgi:hypothetical protein